MEVRLREKDKELKDMADKRDLESKRMCMLENHKSQKDREVQVRQ